MSTYVVSSFWKISRNDGELMIKFILDTLQIISQVMSSQLTTFIRRCTMIGIQPVDTLDSIAMNKPHRTIMVIGETGTGKSTLLNSLVNYLWNVEYDDLYRVKLIYEESKDDAGAQSVTDNVTAYHLDPPALDYQLTLIDTPGFGDTRGLHQDQKIIKQIKKFFEEKIQEIDAICFVVRAPQARLTATQRYIFTQVLGIFGKDIAGNILILMTFADGKKPPVLSALNAANVPFKQAFKLNNSAFDLPEYDTDDEKEENEDIFAQMFWKMGISSFRNLFGAINELEPKSLQMTKQVLSQREELEHYINDMQPLLHNGYLVLEQIQTQIAVVKQYEDIMNINKDFTYKAVQRKSRHIPNNGSFHTTTCLQCNYSCHQHCPYSNNADKSRCDAMDNNGYCRICPSKCHWSLHKNKPYTIEWFHAEETKTIQSLKDKYYDAMNKKSTKLRFMARSVLQFMKIKKELNEIIDKSRGCLDKLMAIALKRNASFDSDYIHTLIQSEENEKYAGWQQRVHSLKRLKEKQYILSKLCDDDYDPWIQYLDALKFLSENEEF